MDQTKIISLKKSYIFFKQIVLVFYKSLFQWILLKMIILAVKVACGEFTKSFSENLRQCKLFISHQK